MMILALIAVNILLANSVTATYWPYPHHRVYKTFYSPASIHAYGWAAPHYYKGYVAPTVVAKGVVAAAPVAPLAAPIATAVKGMVAGAEPLVVSGKDMYPYSGYVDAALMEPTVVSVKSAPVLATSVKAAPLLATSVKAAPAAISVKAAPISVKAAPLMASVKAAPVYTSYKAAHAAGPFVAQASPFVASAAASVKAMPVPAVGKAVLPAAVEEATVIYDKAPEPAVVLPTYAGPIEAAPVAISDVPMKRVPRDVNVGFQTVKPLRDLVGEVIP